LSVDAAHEIVMLEALAAVAVRLVGDVGAVVSAHADVAALIDVLGERFPIASYASTASW
jgi:hypothetical protein